MENNSLAKLSIGINALLVIAVIILFVKMPGGATGEGEGDDSTKVNFSNEAPSRIAYFSNDSVNLKCQFVLEKMRLWPPKRNGRTKAIFWKENTCRRRKN